MNDSAIFLAMLLAIGLGIWGAVVNAGIYCRIGSVWAGFSISVGLAYFGWRPFFGGAHDPATYFGCVMLTLGMLAWLLFRSVAPPAQDRPK